MVCVCETDSQPGSTETSRPLHHHVQLNKPEDPGPPDAEDWALLTASFAACSVHPLPSPIDSPMDCSSRSAAVPGACKALVSLMAALAKFLLPSLSPKPWAACAMPLQEVAAEAIAKKLGVPAYVIAMV